MKHTLKRLTALVLALAMGMSLLCANVWAEEADVVEESRSAVTSVNTDRTGISTFAAQYSSGNWKYTLQDNRAVIVDYTGSASTIVIPSYLNGYKVTQISSNVFKNYVQLRTLTIPESLEKIGSSAFVNCYNLQNIYWNAIDCDVYYFRSSKSSHIFVNAGADSSSLTVTFGPKVTKIPTCIFEGPDEQYAHVTNVVMSDSIESIGDWAFSRCRDLRQITWGNGVKSIGTEAFRNCSQLSSITIPEKVTTIRLEAFKNCYGLSEIRWNAIACNNFSRNYDVFANCGMDAGKLTVIFGQKVKTIPDAAFECNTSVYPYITDVSIPANVVELGEFAFQDCKKLNTVTVKNSKLFIPDGSFSNPFSGCPENLLFVCDKNSTTDKYAQKNGYRVKYLPHTHTYTSKIVKPTYVAQGYTLKTCSVCGTQTKTDYTAKLTVAKTTLSSVSNAKGKKMTVKWKKNSSGTGYQIQYSTKKDFSSGNKSVNITKNSTTSKTITKLTKNKTYYVRIRTYKTVSGTKYYSGWSAVKSVKIKK